MPPLFIVLLLFWIAFIGGAFYLHWAIGTALVVVMALGAWKDYLRWRQSPEPQDSKP